MSSHPTDFQGSVIDALREAIEQQILQFTGHSRRRRGTLQHRSDISRVRRHEHAREPAVGVRRNRALDAG